MTVRSLFFAQGRVAYPTLYSTARVIESDRFVRVIAQDTLSKDAATALLVQWSDGSSSWRMLGTELDSPVL